MIIIIMKSFENKSQLASFLMQIRMETEEIEHNRNPTPTSYRPGRLNDMVDEAEELGHNISQSECAKVGMDIEQMHSQSTWGLLQHKDSLPKKVKNIFVFPPSSTHRLSLKNPSGLYQHPKDIMKYQNIQWTNDKNQPKIVYLSKTISVIGQSHIKLRINVIHGQIWIGLTGNHTKSQLIENSRNQIRLNLNGNEIMVDGQLFSLNCHPFQRGDTITMCTDLSRKMVKFHRNENVKSCLQVTIPDCMAKQVLTAFFELANKGDSITLIV